MKYSVDNSHREFFAQSGWIEFEGLLSATQLAEANAAIDQVLAKRLETNAARMSLADPDALYLAGRDVWRESPVLQKLILQRPLAEMVADLVELRPLRLAFDQVYAHYPREEGVSIHKRLEWDPVCGPLEALAPFQGLACGLFLCLDCAADAAPSFFSRQPGNGICVGPDINLNISQLFRGGRQRYLLITYGKAVTLFVHQLKDPHMTTLRRLGYSFGDRLTDRLHPVVIR